MTNMPPFTLETPAVQPIPVITTLSRPTEMPISSPRKPDNVSVADVYLSAPASRYERPKALPPVVSAPPVFPAAWDATQAVIATAAPAAAPAHASANVQQPQSFRRAPTVNPAMPSLGVLDALLADDSVHDILVNGTESIYIDAGGELIDSGVRFANHDELWGVAETIIKTMGHYWDSSRPMIDTRLPDGSRVNIVAPPMAVDGISISIRKFPKERVTLDRMVANGQLTQPIVDFLRSLVAARLNIIVSGGTGSGKTTLLNALSAAIGSKERVVTIEDSAELNLQQPHVVRLEMKSAGDNEAASVTIRDLVKNALRMRPDRIIVGESRGAEAYDVLQAMNTGHDGSMTSLHANNPRDVLGRLETMVTLAMPQVPLRMVRAQIANTLNIIIQVNRSKEGQRRISHISEVSGLEGDTIILQDLIVYREAEKGQPAGYKWVAGASRNLLITQAAQQAGLMRGFQ